MLPTLTLSLPADHDYSVLDRTTVVIHILALEGGDPSSLRCSTARRDDPDMPRREMRSMSGLGPSFPSPLQYPLHFVVLYVRTWVRRSALLCRQATTRFVDDHLATSCRWHSLKPMNKLQSCGNVHGDRLALF